MTLRGWLTSAVGLKFVMGSTGILLILFLLGHLAGNLLVFQGAEAIDGYSEMLRRYPLFLLIMRVGLLFVAVAHVASAITLTRRNRAARGTGYHKQSFQESPFSSRFMMVGGLGLIVMIVIHLAHLTWRSLNPDFQLLGAFDVYQMLITSFRSGSYLLLYSIFMLLVFLHISHGLWSAVQTFGLTSRAAIPRLRLLSLIFSAGLCLAFMLVPLMIWYGVIA